MLQLALLAILSCHQWLLHSRLLHQANHLPHQLQVALPTSCHHDCRLTRRCPGCDAAASAARVFFLSSMAAALKAAAPGQLTFSGNEGYFGPGDAHVGYNPGAGVCCLHWRLHQTIALPALFGLVSMRHFGIR
jgi:hypothetical protein